MDVLVGRVGRAGTDQWRVLWPAVAEPGDVRQPFADPLRAEREDADAARAVGGRLPYADRRRRAVVPGAQGPGRAGGVRPLPAVQPRPLAHRRAVAAGRSTRAHPAVVRLLAHQAAGDASNVIEVIRS